jgi:hypothetical protein
MVKVNDSSKNKFTPSLCDLRDPRVRLLLHGSGRGEGNLQALRPRRVQGRNARDGSGSSHHQP